jgi:hypothetical protein
MQHVQFPGRHGAHRSPQPGGRGSRPVTRARLWFGPGSGRSRASA